MTETHWQRSSGRPVFIVLASVIGVFALYLIGNHSGASLFGVVVSIGGAGLAAYLVRDAPASAFGVLFALAAMSRFTVELPPGTMRLEQPAIAAVIVALAAERRVWVRPSRVAGPIILGLGLFVAMLALSSIVVAPQPIASLRIVAWYLVSIAGGGAAFLLLRGRSAQALPWLAGVGSAVGAVAAVAATLFFFLWPTWTLGIAGAAGFPRVYAIAWEVNLLASFLMAVLPFALERLRAAPSVTRAGALLLITLGIALAITRGAYLGLAAGLPIQFAALWYWGGRWRRLVFPAAVATACLLVSALAATVLLNRPIPLANPLPSATPWVPPDTIGFRLARLGPALDDLARSPLIGLGAESFGQRHADPSQAGAPDHIAFLAVALPYDSGILGTIGFGVAAGALLVLLARLLRGPGATPLAAAYLGSLVSLLVAYQATNAIHFALNWLIAGAAAALISDVRQVRA